jgi:Mce-associated membrane protein
MRRPRADQDRTQQVAEADAATGDTTRRAAPPPAAGLPAGRLSLALVAALSVLVVVLAGTAGYLATVRHRVGVFVSAYEQTTSVRGTVLTAAKQAAVNMVSQSYHTIDADLDRMSRGATGALAADLAKSRGKAKAAIVKYQIVSIGRAFDAGLVQLSGDHATVLVIVDNTVTNNVRNTTATQRHRFQLDLARVGGRWLVDNLTAIDLTS